MTWGDVKQMQRRRETARQLPFDHLTTPEMVERAKDKKDDEFFFDLSSDMVAAGRRQRWPRVAREGESCRYEVTASPLGEVMLLLLLVDDERYFYRKDGEWIYIGPGDDVDGFVREAAYEVLPTFTATFDARSPSGPDLTLPVIGAFVKELHQYYQSRGKLSYFSYLHADGAYLLVTQYAPEGQADSEPTLFLITSELWLRRTSGYWKEVDDDQIVGDDGEFMGSLISPCLEREAISWWDSLDVHPTFEDALSYCAVFPTFQLAMNTSGHVSTLILETESATWEVEDAGWKRRHQTRTGEVERQRAVESFLLHGDNRARAGASTDDSLSMHRTFSESDLMEGARLGLLTLVTPTLAVEAREWVLLQGACPQLIEGTSLNVTSFLLAAAAAQFVCDDQKVLALVISVGESAWKRADCRWHFASNTSEPHRSAQTSRVDVDIERLPEIAAWWDSMSSDEPTLDQIPGNYDCRTTIQSEADAENDSPALTSDFSILDGARKWTKHGRKWFVELLPSDTDEHGFYEPDFDESLPDWFYNA